MKQYGCLKPTIELVRRVEHAGADGLFSDIVQRGKTENMPGSRMGRAKVDVIR